MKPRAKPRAKLPRPRRRGRAGTRRALGPRRRARRARRAARWRRLRAPRARGSGRRQRADSSPKGHVIGTGRAGPRQHASARCPSSRAFTRMVLMARLDRPASAVARAGGAPARDGTIPRVHIITSYKRAPPANESPHSPTEPPPAPCTSPGRSRLLEHDGLPEHAQLPLAARGLHAAGRGQRAASAARRQRQRRGMQASSVERFSSADAECSTDAGCCVAFFKVAFITTFRAAAPGPRPRRRAQTCPARLPGTPCRRRTRVGDARAKRRRRRGPGAHYLMSAA